MPTAGTTDKGVTVHQLTRRTALIGGAAALALTGCSSSASPSPTASGSRKDSPANSASGPSTAPVANSSAPVTITVAAYDPGSPKETVALVKQQASDFMKANPSITVELKEWLWKADTFGAQLAGGTLPLVFWTPFTEAQSLIARGQVSDLSQELKSLEWFTKINPNLWTVAQNSEGATFGCPFAGYGMALHINRGLFTKAGLNPDKPFENWDEFRAAAKAIKDKTGKIGYAIMAVQNQGGWELTTLAYARGARGEKVEGNTTAATLTDDGYKKALGMLKEMRWTDESLGTNALYEAGPLVADFQAGKIAMIMHVAGIWAPNFMQTGNQDDYGLTALPMDGADAGLLTGGNVGFVTAKATPEQRAAAVKWLDATRYQPMLDKAQAIKDAKAAAAGKLAVGLPNLPVFDQATAEQQAEWIKPYVNAPQAHMTGYTDKIFSLPLAAEPPKMAQDLYAALDDAIQGVQTDKNASVDELLGAAQETIESKLG